MPTYTVVCFLPDAIMPPIAGRPGSPASRACAAAATARIVPPQAYAVIVMHRWRVDDGV